jgi:hypothetical protein
MTKILTVLARANQFRRNSPEASPLATATAKGDNVTTWYIALLALQLQCDFPDAEVLAARRFPRGRAGDPVRAVPALVGTSVPAGTQTSRQP